MSNRLDNHSYILLHLGQSLLPVRMGGLLELLYGLHGAEAPRCGVACITTG